MTKTKYQTQEYDSILHAKQLGINYFKRFWVLDTSKETSLWKKYFMCYDWGSVKIALNEINF